MRTDVFDNAIFELINQSAISLEKILDSDLLFFHGGIYPHYLNYFRDFVAELAEKNENKKDTLTIVLRTPGGSAETAERFVNIIRYHYEKINFIVPDYAFSAGTILCMSGDKIYMDYSSTLGPIDPQVPVPGSNDYVPALGYIDKVKEITEKGNLAPADVVLLKSIDLGKLALFEQARDLSVLLLKDWLVKYKFANWTEHRTTNPGSPVTLDDKKARAEQIALDLANHNKWKSHGRSLDLQKLQELRIEIEDYSKDNQLSKPLKQYNDALVGYVDRLNIPFFMHNRLIAV